MPDIKNWSKWLFWIFKEISYGAENGVNGALLDLKLAGSILWIGLSFCPSIRKFSWVWLLVFSETQYGVRSPCGVVRDRASFLKKMFFLGKWEKCAKNGPKRGFFEFIEKFSHSFFLNLVHKESLYYLLYSCSNLVLGKNVFPELWVKMLVVNQIAGYLHRLYL